jgi:hypothetical protein
VVWAAIELLDDAAKHELLAELREQLAVAGMAGIGHGDWVARAVRSLREARDQLAREGRQQPLSLDTFRELFRVYGREAGWMSDGAIRRTVGGSWNDALRRAGLGELAGGDALVAELGDKLTPEEALTALRDCARTGRGATDVQPVRRVGQTPGRGAPPGPTAPVAGSVRPSLRRLSGGGHRRRPSGRNGTVRIHRDASGTVRTTSGYGYTPDQLRGALREVAARLGRSPKSAEYAREREALLAEEQAAGKPARALPGYSTFHGRYLTWDDALVDAALEPVNGRRNQRHTGKLHGRPSARKIPRAVILDTLREAYSDLGDPFTVARYKTWRNDRVHADRVERRLRATRGHSAVLAELGP